MIKQERGDSSHYAATHATKECVRSCFFSSVVCMVGAVVVGDLGALGAVGRAVASLAAVVALAAEAAAAAAG